MFGTVELAGGGTAKEIAMLESVYQTHVDTLC